MYFALSPQQQHLQDAARAFAQEHSSESHVRRLMAERATFQPAAWKELAGTAGLVTLGSGPAEGGRGGSFVDAVCVLEVLGEHLFPGPALTTTLATAFLRQVHPDDPAAGLLAPMAAGDTIAGVLLPGSGGQLSVTGGGSGELVGLTGVLPTVVDGSVVDHLMVAVDGGGWFHLEAGGSTVRRRTLDSFDQTRGLARLELDGAAARRVRLTSSDESVLATMTLAQQVCVAADLTGVARHCLDAALGYARAREQFGRPIGSFQALQHWFADVAVQVECAWSSTYQAAWDWEHAAATAARSCALAAATAGEASLAAAEQMLQVYGGVGFTWDNPSHLYLKRAKSSRLLWGHPDAHRRRLGELLGL